MSSEPLPRDAWPADRVAECQDRPPVPSPEGRLERAVALLREIHAAPLPLVEADLRHALDTWAWVLTLDPVADEAVQFAALYHDVERLFSESERRVEQHAADYQAFKDAHAARSAQYACQLLATVGVPPAVRHRVAALVTLHERPPAAGEPAGLALLRDADALSFFSCNLEGFRAYYDLEHTRRKVAWTLRRMSPAARRQLASLRLRPDLRELLAEPA